VFLVNSRLGSLHCDHLKSKAPLLPKLRGHFAEFLRESYLAPLSILYLPTCVGFGYGQLWIYDMFELFLEADIVTSFEVRNRVVFAPQLKRFRRSHHLGT
jgi:hypothetical protein